MAAVEVAPNANYNGVNVGIGENPLTGYLGGGLITFSGATYATKFHVINWSFGLAPETSDVTQQQVTAYQNQAKFRDLLGTGTFTNTGDAVITKAAGNENGSDAGRAIGNVALATHASTGPRTLIVGALDKYARTSNSQNLSNTSTRATLASYSNLAGSNPAVQSRFLVEYGGTPYGEEAYLCDTAIPASSGCRNLQPLDNQNPFAPLVGTSFATPRVAGFAAIVRDKFPNLSGGQTATILLDTATTAGLACHTGAVRQSSSCAVSTYGQGRVDIGAALAPTGSLR